MSQKIPNTASLKNSDLTLAPLPLAVWSTILVLALTNAVNYMDRMAISVLLPQIKQEFTLSDTQLGILSGFAFALFYGIAGIAIARRADIGNRKRVISIALVAWSLMTALTGIAQNFWHLLIARVGMGVGEAGCIPPSHSIISDSVPIDRRPGALAIHTAGAALGVVAGLAMVGWLGDLVGWRKSFFILGVLGLLVAVVVRIGVTEPDRPTGGVKKIKSTTVVSAIRELLAQKSFLPLQFAFALSTLASAGLSLWLPSYYVRTFDLSMAEVGLFFGIAYGIGAGIGTLSGGALANKLMRRDLRLGLVIVTAANAFTVPVNVWLILSGSSSLSFALYFVGAVTLALGSAAHFAMIQAVCRSGNRALASSITGFLAAVFGAGLGPLVVGFLSDFLLSSGSAEPLRFALLTHSVIAFAVVIPCAIAYRHLLRDVQRAKELDSDPVAST